MNDEEIKTIKLQLATLFFVLVSDIISIITTYNQKLDLEDKNTFIESKNLFRLTLFNRILIVLLSFIFLYVNYKLYKISKEEGEDLKSYILQIVASILTVISGLIALYVVSLSNSSNIVDVENPII